MQPNPADSRQELCRQLMICRRTVMLYPLEHPQVGQAIEAFRNGLRDFRAGTGRDFTLDSADRPADGAQSDRRNVVVQLGRVLRLNRIRRLSISQDASAREIVEFCRLLRLDSRRGEDPAEGERERRLFERASSWDSIEVTFFELGSERPFDDSPEGPELRHAHGLDLLIRSLPAEARSRLSAGLRDPRFLMKMSLVRRALENLEQPEEGGKRVDLVEEIVRASFPEERSKPIDADEILENIYRLTDFVQGNVGVLAGIGDAGPRDSDRSALRRQLREAISDDATRRLPRASWLQKQKERLSLLFQRAPEPGDEDASFVEEETAGPGALLGEDETQIIPESWMIPEDETQIIFLSPRASESAGGSSPELSSTEPEDDSVYAPSLDEARVAEVYLCVVLDLLHRGRREAVRRRWPTVLDTIHRSTRPADRFGAAVRQVCEYQSKHDDVDAETLLRDMLDARDGKIVARSLREDVLPFGGLDRVRRYLDGLQRRSPSRAIDVLTGLQTGEGGDELDKTARDRLITCARKPEVLARWAQMDPEGLLKVPTLLKVLGALSRRQITDAFRVYFVETPVARSRQLIRKLPPAVPGAEIILFVAMYHGGQALRNAALEKLGDYPTETVMKTLRASLRRNNLRSPFNPDEVRAILNALLNMDHAPARVLLDEVETRRRLLRYVYSADIRGTLAALREERQDLHVTSHRP